MDSNSDISDVSFDPEDSFEKIDQFPDEEFYSSEGTKLEKQQPDETDGEVKEVATLQDISSGEVAEKEKESPVLQDVSSRDGEAGGEDQRQDEGVRIEEDSPVLIERSDTPSDEAELFVQIEAEAVQNVNTDADNEETAIGGANNGKGEGEREKQQDRSYTIQQLIEFGLPFICLFVLVHATAVFKPDPAAIGVRTGAPYNADYADFSLLELGRAIEAGRLVPLTADCMFEHQVYKGVDCFYRYTDTHLEFKLHTTSDKKMLAIAHEAIKMSTQRIVKEYQKEKNAAKIRKEEEAQAAEQKLRTARQIEELTVKLEKEKKTAEISVARLTELQKAHEETLKDLEKARTEREELQKSLEERLYDAQYWRYMWEGDMEAVKALKAKNEKMSKELEQAIKVKNDLEAKEATTLREAIKKKAEEDRKMKDSIDMKAETAHKMSYAIPICICLAWAAIILLLVVMVRIPRDPRFPLNTTPIRLIELNKKEGEQGFGLKLQGVFVKEIIAGGVAETEGQLKVGDEIVALGATNVETWRPSEIHAAIRESGEKVYLWVRANPERF